jgi:hypothetical protein
MTFYRIQSVIIFTFLSAIPNLPNGDYDPQAKRWLIIFKTTDLVNMVPND